MELNAEMLPVSRASELDIRAPEQEWLIRSVWARAAV